LLFIFNKILFIRYIGYNTYTMNCDPNYSSYPECYTYFSAPIGKNTFKDLKNLRELYENNKYIYFKMLNINFYYINLINALIFNKYSYL